MSSLRKSMLAHQRDEALRQDQASVRATAARARLMEQCREVGRFNMRHRCEYTLPLFPLVLILNADGTLAADALRLVEQVQA